VSYLAAALHASIVQHDVITRYTQFHPDISDDERVKCLVSPMITHSVDVANAMCDSMYDVLTEDNGGQEVRGGAVTHNVLSTFYTALNWNLLGAHSIADWVLWIHNDIQAQSGLRLREDDLWLCLHATTIVTGNPDHITARGSVWGFLLVATSFFTNPIYERDHDGMCAYIDSMIDVLQIPFDCLEMAMQYLIHWFSTARDSIEREKSALTHSPSLVLTPVTPPGSVFSPSKVLTPTGLTPPNVLTPTEASYPTESITPMEKAALLYSTREREALLHSMQKEQKQSIEVC
jgi:hypothetical protein